MKTYMAKASEVERQWFVVDAAGQTLGRLASQIAPILMGKHKTTYTPHLDTGDYVIVVNAEQVELTGNKWSQKHYNYHTGYPGGLKSINYETLREKRPELMLELAVKRMLPKNKLGRQMLKKLKIYAGAEHKHEAQEPQKLEI